MARPFLLAAGFGLLTLATLVACDRLVDVVTDSPVKRRYAALYGDEKLDAIVIGSSHAEYGIDVAKLEAPGFRPYNFANMGSGPLYFEPWYQLYRERHGPARWVLLSAEWYWPWLGRVLETDSDNLPWATWAGMLLEPKHHLRTLVTNGFALLRDQPEFRRRCFGERVYWSGDLAQYYRGGVPLTERPFRQIGNVVARAYTWQPPAGAWSAFERLCAQLEADRTRVVVVQTPEYLPDGGSHPQERARIAAIARRHGWPFLDYDGERASALNYDRARFSDWSHLNVVGRAAFNVRLRRDLEAIGAVPPGKGAP